jgi:hypothetical protein
LQKFFGLELLQEGLKMPKRQLAPQIGEVSATEHKSRKRRIKRLVHLRLGYGKSAFFDTHTHQPRYPIDEISTALYKVRRKAKKVDEDLDLSTEEQVLWNQIFKVIVIAFSACLLGFYTDLDGDGIPDFFEFVNHLIPGSMSTGIVRKSDPRRADPDFIEKALGLEDDAIEKSLGLPDHSIEHCCCRMAENDR